MASLAWQQFSRDADEVSDSVLCEVLYVRTNHTCICVHLCYVYIYGYIRTLIYICMCMCIYLFVHVVMYLNEHNDCDCSLCTHMFTHVNLR